jgi:bacterial leucyl aminopeptidase
MKTVSFGRLCGYLLLILSANSLAAPLIVTERQLDAPQANAQLIIDNDNYRIWRTAQATPETFENLYLINVEKFQDKQFDFSSYGKIVNSKQDQFFLMAIKDEAQVARLSKRLHESGRACGSIMRVYGDSVYQKKAPASAPLLSTSKTFAQISKLTTQVSADQIRDGIIDMSSHTTRYHTSEVGKTIASYLAEKYRALAGARSDINIQIIDHGSRTPQPSLVVRINGTTKSDEIVILGSHLDSVNWDSSSRQPAPGADDNASGTATNLEVFRVLMESGAKFERTIEIHAYAAEEVGLVGSQDLAQKYRQQNKNVISMVQQDMNLYSHDGTPRIWLITNNTNSTLNSALDDLAQAYTSVAVESAPLYAGSSDHASWNRQGFAAAFPFENPNGYNHDIHTANDTVDSANNYEQSAAFGQLAVAYLGHYAGLQP